jgi:hypothetical protein
VFCCNMPHCIKSKTICFKFIQKPIMRFYVPLVVNSKIMIFWDTIPCSSVGFFFTFQRHLLHPPSVLSPIFSTLRWRNDITYLKNANYLPKRKIIYSRRPCQSRRVIPTAFIHKRYSHLFLYMCVQYAANLPSKTVN